MVLKKKSELCLLLLLACVSAISQTESREVIPDQDMDAQVEDVAENQQSGYYDEFGNWHSLDEETTIHPATAQDDEPVVVPQRELWTDEQWKDAKAGLDYTKPEEKKKKEKRERETNNEGNHHNRADADEGSSWSFNWPQFPAALGQIIVYSVIIIGLVYIMWRLFFNRQGNRDKKLKPGTPFSIEHIEEHLEESDLDRFLRLAIEAGDYKSAVRILYLAIIKSLHENRLIKWKKEKTNFDFVVEMRPSAHYRSFRDVTRAFELVWYGDMEVTENKYQTLHDVFRKFLNQVSNGQKK